MAWLFEQYETVWSAFSALPYCLQNTALAVAMMTGVVIIFCHELGHWFAARAIGVEGRIGFFVRRKTSRLWFLSVMGVTIDDVHFAALSTVKKRLIVAGGPVVDVVASTLLLAFGLLLPGPSWLTCGIALLGALYLPLTAMNIVPMRHIRNDGWVFFRPQDAI
jgi:membrane-associated protease RseP (regulator of RpoE activity)